MHELALAEDLVDAVVVAAAGARITRVVVEVGKVIAVVPDALRFSFEVASEGTAASGAALDIVETPGVARCRGCGEELELEVPYGRCSCGEAELDWLSGMELRIREMEVV